MGPVRLDPEPCPPLFSCLGPDLGISVGGLTLPEVVWNRNLGFFKSHCISTSRSVLISLRLALLGSTTEPFDFDFYDMMLAISARQRGRRCTVLYFFFFFFFALRRPLNYLPVV